MVFEAISHWRETYMRAYEFITEVLDLSAPAPSAVWQHDIDSEGNKISVGTWKDSTGQKVENWFTKDPKGDVKIVFSRTDTSGEPLYGVTNTGQGKQSSIMTGATKHVSDYIRNNPDVNKFKFTSSADSRTKLYNRMVDRLASQAGMIGTSRYDPDFERTEYELRKAQPGEKHTPLSTPRIKPDATPPTPSSVGRGVSSGSPMSPSTTGTGYINRSPQRGPLSGGGSVPTGTGDLLHQMNPQKLY